MQLCEEHDSTIAYASKKCPACEEIERLVAELDDAIEQLDKAREAAGE